MTWSIIAADAPTGLRGIAASSAFMGVGGQIIYSAQSGAIVACQGVPNQRLGAELVKSTQESLEQRWLMNSEHVPPTCQVHYMTPNNSTHCYTGKECLHSNGERTCRGLSVSGNTLASPTVIDATFSSFIESRIQFDYRLTTALLAGQQVGGDRRGQQSAAVKIWDANMRVVMDLRIDDQPNALEALIAMVNKAQSAYKNLVKTMLSQS